MTTPLAYIIADQIIHQSPVFSAVPCTHHRWLPESPLGNPMRLPGWMLPVEPKTAPTVPVQCKYCGKRSDRPAI